MVSLPRYGAVWTTAAAYVPRLQRPSDGVSDGARGRIRPLPFAMAAVLIVIRTAACWTCMELAHEWLLLHGFADQEGDRMRSFRPAARLLAERVI